MWTVVCLDLCVFFFVSAVCVLIMNSSNIYTVTEISETTQ